MNSMHSVVDGLAEFEANRRRLQALAYRMLGSRAQAEDVVQDVWLRWHETARATVENPQAWLSTIVTRLCLDHLRSAKAQREIYIGTWLPEPLVDDDEQFQPGPHVAHELASDLSFAFMLTLECLSPLERAAFLLHDVFEMSFSEIAVVLERSVPTCRQLATRARANVTAKRAGVAVTQEAGERLAMAFVSAARDGDVAALAKVLAEDASFWSDGGGRANAVPGRLLGRDLIAKVLIGFANKLAPGTGVRATSINGLPGLVVSDQDGTVIQTLAFEIDANQLISAVYVMRNPDKLQKVAP